MFLASLVPIIAFHSGDRDGGGAGEYGDPWRANIDTSRPVGFRVEVIPPPYIEVSKLYKPFPIIVYSSRFLNLSQTMLAIEDSNNTYYYLEILDAKRLGVRNGMQVYKFTVEFRSGYYTPGTHKIILSTGEGIAEANLTLLGANTKPLIRIESARIAGANATITLYNNMSSSVRASAFIANCGGGSGEETIPAGGRGVLTLGLTREWCGRAGVLTAVVVLESSNGVKSVSLIPVVRG